MREAPLSAKVFAVAGLALILIGIALAWLGSFAYPLATSVGMFLLAGALASRFLTSPWARSAAILAVAAAALLTFGMTATPLFYLGWGVLAGAITLLIVFGRRP